MGRIREKEGTDKRENEKSKEVGRIRKKGGGQGRQMERMRQKEEGRRR